MCAIYARKMSSLSQRVFIDKYDPRKKPNGHGIN